MTDAKTELKCQEASPASKTTYVPCGRPAVHSVRHNRDGRSYNMCEACTDHNVKNRGGQLEGMATANNPDLPVDHAQALKDVLPAEPVYDYGEYGGQDGPKSSGELAQLSDLAEQARQAEYAVEEAQRELKRLQGIHQSLVETQIPTLMEQVGMEKFSTSSGLNIEIRESIRASLGSGPEKDRNLDWLEKSGHEAIIKLAVSVAFGRGDAEREKAKALATRLREEGVDAIFDRKVEPSTLSALIRELLEEGRPVPEEAFHVFRQRVAKIK